MAAAAAAAGAGKASSLLDAKKKFQKRYFDMVDLLFPKDEKTDVEKARERGMCMYYAFDLLTMRRPSHMSTREFDEKKWKQPTRPDALRIYKRVSKLYPLPPGQFAEHCHPSVEIGPLPDKADDAEGWLKVLDNGYKRLRYEIDHSHHDLMDSGYQQATEEEGDVAWSMYHEWNKRREIQEWCIFGLFLNRIVQPLVILGSLLSVEATKELLTKYVFLPPPNCVDCNANEWKDGPRPMSKFRRCETCMAHRCAEDVNCPKKNTHVCS